MSDMTAWTAEEIATAKFFGDDRAKTQALLDERDALRADVALWQKVTGYTDAEALDFSLGRAGIDHHLDVLIKTRDAGQMRIAELEREARDGLIQRAADIEALEKVGDLAKTFAGERDMARAAAAMLHKNLTNVVGAAKCWAAVDPPSMVALRHAEAAESVLSATDAEVAAWRAGIESAARARALEEAAKAVEASAEKPGRGMSGTNRTYLYRAAKEVRALATTDTRAEAIESFTPHALGSPKCTYLAIDTCNKCGWVAASFPLLAEKREDPHEPAFYAVGQTGVEAAPRPTVDAKPHRCHNAQFGLPEEQAEYEADFCDMWEASEGPQCPPGTCVMRPPRPTVDRPPLKRVGSKWRREPAKKCPRCGSTDFRCADHEFCANCTSNDETFGPPAAKPETCGECGVRDGHEMWCETRRRP